MKTRTKQRLITLAVSGVIVGSSLVGAQAAQNAQSGGAGSPQQDTLQTVPENL